MLSWECKSKFVKQLPIAVTQKRGPAGDVEVPGPASYEPPQIFCGSGFSKIKRSPAYTFGINTPTSYAKPAVKPNALLLNIEGYTRKGRTKIPGSIVTPVIELSGDKSKIPGPNAYDISLIKSKGRRTPAYTMSLAAKPTYEPWDQWTPPPNMYCPPIMTKRSPAFTLRGIAKERVVQPNPSPVEYDAKYYVEKKNAPKYSFGHRFRPDPLNMNPPPNTYCNKLFMSNKRMVPAPSFGIKHSPYAGQ